MKESSFEMELNESENSIDLKKVLQRIFRFWPWMLFSLIIALFLGYVYLRYTPTTYASAARIKVVEDSQETDIAQNPMAKVWSDSKINTDNETAILKSYRLLSLVVDSLNLNIAYFKIGSIQTTPIWNPPFIVIPYTEIDNSNTSVSYTIEMEANRFVITNENGARLAIPYFSTNQSLQKLPFKIELTEEAIGEKITHKEYLVTFHPFKQTVTNLAKNLDIQTISKKSDVLELTLRGENPLKSETILNTIIHEFNLDGIRDRQQISRRTLEFIDDRFEYLTRELDSIEGGKQDFKQENNLSYIEADAGNSLDRKSETENKVSDLETQISLANILKRTVRVQKKHKLLPVNIGLENPSLNNLVNNYNEMALEREKLLISVGESHPTLTALSGQLERAKTNISKTVNVYQSQLRTALSSLNEEKNKANTMFSSLPEKEKMLRAIERQQSIKENLFLLLLQRREEAAINLAVTAPSVKVVDYGLTDNKPVAPKKLVVMGIAGIMGLLLPLLILYIRFTVNNKLQGSSDFANDIKDFPLLAEIPHFKKEKQFKNINESTILAESYRILATKLDANLPENITKDGRVIFSTSSIANEGKSITAFNLSVAYASLNKKVLLVDANLRNPEMHEQLGISNNTKGLSDYLQSTMYNWQEIILPGLPNCDTHHVCPAGSLPENPAQLLSKSRFDDFIKKARETYDIIIVDTTPIISVTDTLLISKFADVILYITRAGVTETSHLQVAKELKISHKIKHMAFVLNDVH